MPRPTIGRIVLFKVSEDVVRPAIITQTWNDDCVNLVVFPDGTNDGAAVDWDNRFHVRSPQASMAGGYMGGVWVTSVTKGDSPGQWNWPPKGR